MGECTLTLSALLGENVRLEGVLTLHFAGTGQLETLFGTRLGFYFGHGLWLIIDCLVLTPNDLRNRQRQPSTTGVKLFGSGGLLGRLSLFRSFRSFILIGGGSGLRGSGFGNYGGLRGQVEEHSLAFELRQLLYLS